MDVVLVLVLCVDVHIDPDLERPSGLSQGLRARSLVAVKVGPMFHANPPLVVWLKRIYRGAEGQAWTRQCEAMYGTSIVTWPGGCEWGPRKYRIIIRMGIYIHMPPSMTRVP